MFRQYSFWLELILMLVVPMPYKKLFDYDDNSNARIVFMEAVNWIGNAGVNDA